MASATRSYVIDYQRGAGLTPWAVYRMVSTHLTASGRVWLCSFATKGEAEAWVEARL